jgi:hypothetical protein
MSTDTPLLRVMETDGTMVREVRLPLMWGVSAPRARGLSRKHDQHARCLPGRQRSYQVPDLSQRRSHQPRDCVVAGRVGLLAYDR